MWVTTLTVEVTVFTVISQGCGNVICSVCGRVSEEAKVVAEEVTDPNHDPSAHPGEFRMPS